MPLDKYQAKRNFRKTPEPRGTKKKHAGELIFVVQKHDASHLHYDFRLEMDGVLKSWAVPKGPSLNPEEKRLAVQVEDHPYAYKDFEGVIPEGNYGAGNVIIWDAGTYMSLKEWPLEKQLKTGHLEIELRGKKLRGSYDLVRMKDGKNWLLIKKHDRYESTRDVRTLEKSVVTGRTLKKHVGKDVMPHHVAPMLATLTDKPFDDKDWLFEVKWDGYRALAEVKKGKVALYSRNKIDFTQRYKSISEALAELQHDVVLDGEIVAMDKDGVSRFQLLQEYTKTPVQLTYRVFDLLFLDGTDLRTMPLLERKKLLELLLPQKGPLQFSDHIEEKGKALFKEAQKRDWEGIMAKRKHSAYESKRTQQWLKIKTEKRQEAIICGYTAPRNSREQFGALVLGMYINGELTFVGHTGSGFDRKSLLAIHAKLQPLEQKTSPFSTVPETNMPVTWVKPVLVCEVKFAEWTKDLRMRQPIFLGLREDKKAASVGRETTQAEKQHMTHPEKIYWPALGLTKKDLVQYYDKIAATMLPYLKDRPESLNRHPDGVDKPGFFQKDINFHTPESVEIFTQFSEASGRDVHYLVCNNKEALLYMANLGCVEINPWNSRLRTISKPDYLVIDLDPGENTFQQVVTVAKAVHEVLERAGLPSYVKTSGKTGLHIFVPTGARYSYTQIRQFAEILVTLVHQKLPEITSIERSPAKRRTKIYLDFLQNSEGQTLAAPYSLRPTPEATVSTPLRWEEVNGRLDPKKFTIKAIFRRLKKYGDLWQGMLQDAADIAKAIERLENQ